MHSELVPRPSAKLLRTSMCNCSHNVHITSRIPRMQTTVRAMALPHRTALLEHLNSTSSLPIALQGEAPDLLRPIAFSKFHQHPLVANSEQTRYEPQAIYQSITTLVSRCIPHRFDKMGDDRNFHRQADKAGEASMNIQALEERLADLKKQFRKANTTFSSADASPVNPYEVRVSLITGVEVSTSLSERIPKLFPIRYTQGPNRSQRLH